MKLPPIDTKHSARATQLGRPRTRWGIEQFCSQAHAPFNLTFTCFFIKDELRDLTETVTDRLLFFKILRHHSYIQCTKPTRLTSYVTFHCNILNMRNMRNKPKQTKVKISLECHCCSRARAAWAATRSPPLPHLLVSFYRAETG